MLRTWCFENEVLTWSQFRCRVARCQAPPQRQRRGRSGAVVVIEHAAAAGGAAAAPQQRPQGWQWRRCGAHRADAAGARQAQRSRGHSAGSGGSTCGQQAARERRQNRWQRLRLGTPVVPGVPRHRKTRAYAVYVAGVLSLPTR